MPWTQQIPRTTAGNPPGRVARQAPQQRTAGQPLDAWPQPALPHFLHSCLSPLEDHIQARRPAGERARGCSTSGSRRSRRGRKPPSVKPPPAPHPPAHWRLAPAGRGGADALSVLFEILPGTSAGSIGAPENGQPHRVLPAAPQHESLADQLPAARRARWAGPAEPRGLLRRGCLSCRTRLTAPFSSIRCGYIHVRGGAQAPAHACPHAPAKTHAQH